MKNTIYPSVKKVAALIAVFLLFTACSNDDDTVEPPLYFSPNVSLDITSGEFGVGQIITVEVSMLASGLLNTLTISAGNTVLENITYGDTGDQDFRFSFQVPPEWLGTVQTIAFTVTDKQGQQATTNYTATVSQIEPQYTIDDITLNGVDFRQITGNVNFDETLDNDTNWVLNGSVEVDQQTTLTIEEGTTVYALNGDTELDIKIGGTLLAEGTLENPIVFTSLANAPGQSGTPDAGDWIGVTLRGNDTPDDSSGILTYVRIEYAGNDDDAFQLRQVGGNTVIDYLQVFDVDDTGVRIRGGSVNLKHLVVVKPDSRCVRYGEGWTGNGQFWALATSTDSRAINGTDDNAVPQSNPLLSNITVVGANITEGTPGVGEGVRMQDGANGRYYNTVLLGFDVSFRVRDGGEITMRNCAVFNNGENGDDDGLHSSVRNQYREASNNNSEDPFTITDTFVGVSTANSSNALSLGSFFEGVNYVGAVPADDDWTLGWTRNFDGSFRE
ncbi:hypothetical protein [Ascidiimonas aurantiaca]|uniref:hypothetical protein n=1 Tax=Ascidiimonas aurantiaca TaxID=1685432 RepID=UPI0030EBD915